VGGKTEIENFDKNKIIETYGILPKELIEVKGLMGDTSDNIPGVPGVGEKTALSLIKEYKTLENLYNNTDNLKGKMKENIENNKDMAYLSRQLGTIDINVPVDKNLEDFKVSEWDRKEVLELFKTLRFNRFIERFDLEKDSGSEETDKENLFEYIETDAKEIVEKIKEEKNIYYAFEIIDDEEPSNIIKKKIKKINVYIEKENKVYNSEFDTNLFKEVFEQKEISKYGHKIKIDYILLKQLDINPKNFVFDSSIGAYLLNASVNSYTLEEIAKQYLNIDIDKYCSNDKEEKVEQTSLFDSSAEETATNERNYRAATYAYVIGKVKPIIISDLEKINSLKLFEDIEMKTAEVLADMQFEGICVDQSELVKFGEGLKKNIEELRIDIYKLANCEFNINSTKQLGEVLFEKLNLTVFKKTKNGYSTDGDTLEKIKDEHPIVEKILDYRQLMKLNSTYVEGMIPYINPKTGRIHTFFHQTVTSTGRISSTEPNLQNIPTRTELGKKLRKAFKAEEKNILLDADYSQIELRVLAHMSNDEIMIKGFNEDADIHTITASEIFKVPIEDVSKQLRSRAKAVNFGIVYGISDFGLSEQIDINRKEAKKYIEQYLETYHGIKEFMDKTIEDAKRKGYAETIFNRRRYMPEINSNNHVVRKFGERAAMNMPIQGTAADIMKIAMINVYNMLKEKELKSKIVLQVHDELLIECLEKEKDEVIQVLRNCMENAAKLKVPLKVDIEEGRSWFQTK